MSAWVIALGLSAGYLINKNLTMKHKLEERMTTYQQNAQPATDGPPTAVIRDVQRNVPDADRFQDMNVQDLPPKDIKKLESARDAQAAEVRKFEMPSVPEIEGVWLPMRGVS